MPRARKYDGVVYRRTGTEIWWIRYRDRKGIARRESSQTADWQEASKKLRERLQARDDNLLEVVRKGETLAYEQWADFFLENYSKPPVRAAKTHEANGRCIKHLKAAFGISRLVDITADSIELYLRERLRQRVRVKVKLGYKLLGAIKSTTIHQEFRVLRRMLNVAVRKKLLVANPCSGVEFPVAVKGLFRPHYVAWSEQQTIESHGPQHLRNIIRIITETGLRVYKELTPMKKDKWTCTMRLSGYRIQRRQTGSPRFLSPRSPSKHSRARWRFLVKGRFCFRVIGIRAGTKRRSRLFGKKLSDGQRFPIFGSTIFVPRTPRG